MVILNKTDCVLLNKVISSCLKVASILQIPEPDLLRLYELQRHFEECPIDIKEDPTIEDPELLI
jgi:hypothetical protein